jgi:heat shock protein 5
MTKDNNLLGEFDLTNIPPSPRGVPQIEVTFEIDANGILKVSALDKGTGKSESITITNDQRRLSADEIERMVREAEEFADEDAAVKKRIESMNSLQNFVFSLKSQVADAEGMGGKLSDEDKETILAAVKEKTEWLDDHPNAEAEDYEDQLAELQSTVSPITAKLYSGGAGGGYGDDQMPFSHDEL